MTTTLEHLTYVTTKGNVVIGRFPIDQAHRVAALCKAAPDLLEACMRVGAGLCLEENVDGLKAILAAAVAKARPA